jgi:hypothetical protein
MVLSQPQLTRSGSQRSIKRKGIGKSFSYINTSSGENGLPCCSPVSSENSLREEVNRKGWAWWSTSAILVTKHKTAGT